MHTITGTGWYSFKLSAVWLNTITNITFMIRVDFKRGFVFASCRCCRLFLLEIASPAKSTYLVNPFCPHQLICMHAHRHYLLFTVDQQRYLQGREGVAKDCSVAIETMRSRGHRVPMPAETTFTYKICRTPFNS